MNRQELADGIEDFCKDAPEGMLLVRYVSSPGTDVFAWFAAMNIHHLTDNLPSNCDIYLYKAFGSGLVAAGRFRRYMENGKFDKKLYLNPV